MAKKLLSIVVFLVVASVLSAIARRRSGQHGSVDHLHGTPHEWPPVARKVELQGAATPD